MVLTLGFVASAQNHGDRNNMRRELREYKLKYLAQEMELTAAQQPKFFDLYEKMMKEKHAAYSETMALKRKLKNEKNARDADYEALTTAMRKAKVKDQEIEKRYEKQFSTFLSAKQIYKWKEAEEKFRQRMQEMRSQKKKGK